MTEFVGLVAAFTGVIGFIGQSIDGIVKLKQFFRCAQSSPNKIKLLLTDFDNLLDRLEKVRSLLRHLQNTASKNPGVLAEIEMIVIEQEIRNCKKDIETWVQIAEYHDIKTATGFHGFFNRLRIAASPNEIAEFQHRIALHTSKMSSNISILNSFFTYISAKKMDGIISKVQTLAETRGDLSAANTKKRLELGTKLLETESQHDEDLEHSMVSSVEGQSNSLNRSFEGLDSYDLSQEDQSSSQERDSYEKISQEAPAGSRRIIEGITESEMMSVGRTSPLASHVVSQEHWCCDTVSGIDTAFVRSDHAINTTLEACIYCWDYPYGTNSGRETDADLTDDSWSRGNHLVSRHFYGQCNLELEYNTWEEMREHLVEFHFADGKRLRKRDVLHEGSPRAGLSRDMRSSGQYSRLAHEPASEHLLIEAKIVSLLLKHKLCPTLVKPFRPRDRLMMASVLEALYLKLFDAHDRLRELAAVLREAACLEEELILTCGLLLPFCWSAATDCRQINKTLLNDTNLDVTIFSLHSHGQLRWMCTQPSQYVVGPSLRECRPCEEGTRYMSKEAAYWHLKMDHSKVKCRDLWVQQTGSRLPGAASQLIVPRMSNGTNSRNDRINLWLMRIFIESNHVRTVFRCDSILNSPSSLKRSRRDENPSADDISRRECWAIPIILHWFSDETNTNEHKSFDDHPLQLSSGAIDSREMSELHEINPRWPLG